MYTLQKSRTLIDLYHEIDLALPNVNSDLVKYHLYNVSENLYRNKDVFDILTHHVFTHLIDKIHFEITKGNKVIFLICERCRQPNKDELYHAITRVAKLARRVLPVHCVDLNISIDEFVAALADCDVCAVGQIEKIERKIERNTFKSFNLNKMIKYLDNRGLRYLSTEYFKHLNSKLLAANK